MSPLFLVGILVSTALANDVQFSLKGQSPADPKDINALASQKNAFQTGNPQDFWWMSANSPFKDSYENFKKCSAAGNCLPPTGLLSSNQKGGNADLGAIDVKKNPFLNGVYEVGSPASFASSFSASSSSSSSSGLLASSAFGTKTEGVAGFHSGVNVDVSKNPFLNGQFVTTGNGEKVRNENGFLGVQPKTPGFATTHPLANKKPFSTTKPGSQEQQTSFVLGGNVEGNEIVSQGNKVGLVACKGQGYICVAKNLCENGIVNKNGEGLLQVRNKVEYCDIKTQECCRLPRSTVGSHDFVLGKTAVKSAFPTSINDLLDKVEKKSEKGSSKLSGRTGSSSGHIKVLTDDSLSIKPQVFHAGESGSNSNTAKPTRDTTTSANSIFQSTPDYSDVQFDSDVRFSSTIKGPAYLPPFPDTTPTISTYEPSIPTTPSIRPCPPGSYLTSARTCETPKAPSCPFGTVRKPDGSCQTPTTPVPSCPYGTARKPDGSCERTTTPEPSCPFGTIRKPDGTCVRPSTPAPPCPFGTKRQPDGSCRRPTCPFGTITKPDGTCESPKPVPTCPSGTVKKPDGSCERPTTPTPSCPFGTIRKPDGTCERPTTPEPTCPFGTIRKPDGSCERPTSPSPYCPPGTIRKPDGDCERSVTPIPSCPIGTIRNPDGSCSRPTTPKPACPFGTIRQPDGNCERPITSVPSCPFGTVRNPDGSCGRPTTPTPSCPYGTIRKPDGSCQRPVTPTPSCPFETIRNPDGSCSRPTTPAPTCPFGVIRKPDGSCETPTTPAINCPPGWIQKADGTCERPITPTPSCPFGTIRNADGTCGRPTTPTPSCPFGTIRKPDGSCVTPTTPVPSCPFGTIRKPDGRCERPTPSCPFGTIRKPDGSCETSTTPKPSCPFGTIREPDGSCDRPTSPAPYCPSGTVRKPDGTCERPVTPTPSCPFGTIRNPDGSCRRPTTPEPSCPFGTIRKPDGSCERPTPSCPFGANKKPDGSCETPTTAKPSCPFGTVRKPDGSCGRPITSTPSCPYDTIRRPDGSCEKPTTPKPSCPFGTIRNPDGSCRGPSTPATPCPFDTIRKPDGTCGKSVTPEPTCPFGTIRKPDGSCQRPSTSIPCPFGTIKRPDGSCETTTTPEPRCPQGTIRKPDGSCEKPAPSCPFGTVIKPDGTCERPTPKKCPPGTTKTPFGTCERLTTTTPSTMNREYLPPVSSTKPSTIDDGYHYDKPHPTFSYPTTEHEQGIESSINNVISVERPEGPDNTGDSANTDNVFVQTTRRPENVPSYKREDINSAPAGCAAALKCVQEIYCTAEGVVSPVPVVLTKEQELLRAPTTVCKDLESGITGKCCRDPNYKDPWPSANLVDGFDDGQYKEDNFYGQHELGSNRLVRASNSTRRVRRPARNSAYEQNTQSSQPTCGERHLNTKPPGSGPLDANFAEYPWQAMILRDSNRSLLCGGAIIGRDAVLTAAHCVEGLQTSDVLIKGGEWKLGIDEEPLPFQIVKVAAIIRHPDYKFGSYQNDMAVLKLTEKLRVTKNVGTICLPEPNTVSTANCKVTGWGKRILQLHAKGAIMHHIDVKIMDPQQCQQTLSERFQDSVQHYSSNTLCGYSDIDQCKVDYGSALACANDQGQYSLSGIFSWDTGCKQEGQIGGYVAPDVEWIQRTLTKSLKELRKLDREYLLSNSN
nr:mediator of DNA damage checkpoint protein 1-like [Leptinotarsa decemlineata]